VESSRIHFLEELPLFRRGIVMSGKELKRGKNFWIYPRSGFGSTSDAADARRGKSRASAARRLRLRPRRSACNLVPATLQTPGGVGPEIDLLNEPHRRFAAPRLNQGREICFPETLCCAKPVRIKKSHPRNFRPDNVEVSKIVTSACRRGAVSFD
jgi:hypothetical protein